jgi:putative oxidoreductase
MEAKLTMTIEAEGMWVTLAAAACSLIAVPFLFSVISKQRNWSAGLAEMRALGFPLPAQVSAPTAVLQLDGGSMLVLGWHASWVSATLAAHTILTSLMSYPLLRSAGTDALRQMAECGETVAIAGGLRLVVAHD